MNWLWFKSWCFRIIYGKISSITHSIDGGFESEIEYFARGRSIGYWAYGQWEPGSIYHGQALLSFCFED